MNLFKEFRAPIVFLSKFLILYLVLNIGYGLFVNRYSPAPDPFTVWTTRHTGALLHLVGFATTATPDRNGPYVLLIENDATVLSVFEGCNGINVAIIFISFLLAFGRPTKRLLWFIPLGLLIIHFTNLLRIGLLFYVTKNMSDYLYFTHKYLFTAIIYLAVFFMWYLWLSRIQKYHAMAN